ncbi:MAG: Uma2 family endonuclease [Abditibacteriales bacterium]|nr:Uma2 family endonuclease [Abditibacteriales bacterium]
MTMLIEALEAYFAQVADLLVRGNVLLFEEPGNPKRFVVPDLFVVRGVPKAPLRESCFAWREGKYPDFILELLSERTAARDRTEEWVLYER